MTDLNAGKSFWRSAYFPVGLIAALNFGLHLAVIRGYGIFRDELYYLACANHPALGYVDQPSLSIFVLKLVRMLAGDSLTAIRILPALGGAAFVVLTGLIAREIGGKKYAMTLAAAAAFATTGNLFMFHIYSMNFIDILFWQACLLVFLRIVNTGRSKLWLLFGALAGIGFENKVSVVFLLFGLSVGIVATEKRRFLSSRFLWMGAGIAAVLFVPYAAWNLTHGWPTLEFMRNAVVSKNIANTPLGFLRDQIFYNNPFTLLVWLPGLFFFILDRDGKRYRPLGWMYLSLFVLFLVQHGKDYYLAGVYPVLFAGGAVWIEARKGAFASRLFRPAAVASLLITALLLSPVTLPILPPPTAVAYFRALGIHGSQERHEMGPLPQHFADEFGWENMAATIAGILQTLAPEDRAKCVIFLRNYGEAGAVDYFGGRYGLPKAYSAHNNYWFWGPPMGEPRVAIIMGDSKDVQASLNDLKQYFEEVTPAGAARSEYAMPYENDRPIFVCRGFRFSFRDIWPKEKNFG